MSYILDIPTFSDPRGNLSVLDEVVPYAIKRVYFITGAVGTRGGHRHKKTIQGLISIAGECTIFINDGVEKKEVLLNDPRKLLILDPKDWHTMHSFSKNNVLLVISSEHYDRNDYIDEPYKD